MQLPKIEKFSILMKQKIKTIIQPAGYQPKKINFEHAKKNRFIHKKRIILSHNNNLR